MSRFPLLIAAALTLPLPGRAQEAHHDDVEVIEAPAVPDKSPTPDLAKAAAAIVEQTNAFRKAEKLAAVAVDDKLKETAQAFADYMAKEDRYGHTADGQRPADRATKHGYDYCLVLENIAYAYNSQGFTADTLATELTTGWKNSPGHRKNMLDPDVGDTAVAVARSAKTGYYYAVQVFGRPKSQAIVFKVENKAGAAVDYRVGDKAFSLPAGYTRTHTVCRPPPVAFTWPGEQKAGEPVKAMTGQKLVVTRAGDKWSVAAE